MGKGLLLLLQQLVALVLELHGDLLNVVGLFDGSRLDVRGHKYHPIECQVAASRNARTCSLMRSPSFFNTSMAVA